jgi:tetratricopeptide (TPR) repeat protein
VVNPGWAPPGANPIGAATFAGGWTGLSAAAGAASAYSAADAASRSGGADTVRGWYDREYARDLATRWPWWSAGGWGSGGSGSGGGYGSSGGGYGGSDGGYSNPYSTDAGQGTDSSANAASQEQSASQAASAAGKEDAANADTQTAAKQCMETAVLAFQQGDYAEAQKGSEEAIRLGPRNANVDQFRALCQFAQGKYKDAAATIHLVLTDGPGWNWKTARSLYKDVETYTKQLRALEGYVKEDPKDAAGRFVLAYHYLVLDHQGAAVRQLQQVVELQPRDRLSAAILNTLEKARNGNAKAPTAKPAPGR